MDALLVIGLIAGFVLFFVGMASEELLVLAILGPLISLVCVILIRVRYTKSEKKKEEQARLEREALAQRQAMEIGGTGIDRFFIECLLGGYTDFSNGYSRQKAQIIAEKYHLAYPDGIDKLYEKAKNEHEQISAKLNEKMLDNLRTKEKNDYLALNRYSDLYGREKRIQILSDMLNKEYAGIDATKKLANIYLMGVEQERERDWATWGGIAGASAAIAIQAENAEIRARNESRKQEAINNYNTTMSRISYKNADQIKKQLEEAREMVVSEHTADEVLDMLNFDDTQIQISKTGAFMITVTVSPNCRLVIYDKISAIVDGTIIAKVYDGEKLIGSPKLVLPLDGIYRSTKIRGMELSGADPSKTYTVKFSAEKLWLMGK